MKINKNLKLIEVRDIFAKYVTGKQYKRTFNQYFQQKETTIGFLRQFYGGYVVFFIDCIQHTKITQAS